MKKRPSADQVAQAGETIVEMGAEWSCFEKDTAGESASGLPWRLASFRSGQPALCVRALQISPPAANEAATSNSPAAS
jgi:hypothetical protein